MKGMAVFVAGFFFALITHQYLDTCSGEPDAPCLIVHQIDHCSGSGTDIAGNELEYQDSTNDVVKPVSRRMGVVHILHDWYIYIV